MQLSHLNSSVANRAIPHTRLPTQHTRLPPSAPRVNGIRILENKPGAQLFEYRFTALLSAPERVDLLLGLGSWCREIGWPEYAELFYERALEFDCGSLRPVLHSNLAHALLEQSKLLAAKTHYETTLRIRPDLVAARRGLCSVALALGDSALAARQVAALEEQGALPFPEYASLRGELALLASCPGPAREWLRSAARHDPLNPRRWRHFIETLSDEPWRALIDELRAFDSVQQPRIVQIAEAALDGLLQTRLWTALSPLLAHLSRIGIDCMALYETAARALYDAGELDAMINLCRDAMLTGDPSPTLLEIAAVGHTRKLQFAEARDYFTQALQLAPVSSSLLSNISHFLLECDRLDGGMFFARRAVDAAPNAATSHLAIAKAYHKAYRLDDAVAACRRALALPGLTLDEQATLSHALGQLLIDKGSPATAAQALAGAAELSSDAACGSLNARANLYRDDLTLKELARAHHAAGQIYVEEFGKYRRTHWPNSRIPSRRLRIGFVSPDLHHHPIGLLLASWLPRVDRNLFEIHCYATSAYSDSLTERLKLAAHHWHLVHNMPQVALGERISWDEIDILVDLSGHAEGNSLGVFATKPAPIQLSWGGSLFTTGIPAIDYVVHDRYSARRDADFWYAERVARLACMSYCYVPPEPLPPVAAAPAMASGYVTFGSFNHVATLSDHTISLWARVMRAVPTARLYLKSAPFTDPAVVADCRARFRALGVTPQRLRIEGPGSFEEYLVAYDQVDIALDTFPVNAGVTSLQGLWQGVPLLTRAGPLHASRLGGSAMHALNLSSWVAETDAQFVAAAAAKALDFENLNRLRMRLRDRLGTITVGNGRLFAARMEQLWRQCWYEYCREGRSVT